MYCSAVTTRERIRPVHRFGGRWALFACAGLLSLTGCLNPAFVNQTVGNLYPSAPGAEPFIGVRVINDTTATLEVPIVYDTGTVPTFTYLIRELSPGGRDTGILLDWPVLRVSLGNLDNPALPLIIANYPDGRTSSLILGRLPLEAGVDYDRGDTIIFHFTQDSRSALSLKISVGYIDGATQQGTFLRGNPYERLDTILQLSNF